MTTAHTPTILVVDDEPAIRDLLQEALEDQGYAVYVATNGRTALAALHEALPDLVITDLMMPDIDGRALAAQMATDLHAAHIPIVLISAAYQPDPADHFMATLRKPFDLTTLFAVVERCLP